MGNSKFFFSDMIQNSWFYKLKYMSKTKSQKSMQKSTITKNQLNTKSSPPHATTHAPPQPHHLCQQRKSYHFTRDLINTPYPPSPNSTNSASQLPNTPTKPSKTRKSIKKQMIPSYVASSVSTDTSFGINVESGSVWTKPDSTADDYPPDNSSSEDDNASIFPCIVPKNGDFNLVPQVELPTIVTKKTTTSYKTEEARKNIKSPIRKVTVKLRTNSSRLIASKRFAQVNDRENVSTSGAKRRSLSESLAVMKLSRDPYKDFKESMVEMIMVNNMTTSKDLEDLLTCYLSLNSDKYHDVIIKVFKQIWLETINDIKLLK